MGMPVKLSDDLVQSARAEAAVADRSITAQIEHWAKLGQAVEAALRHPEVSALKRTGGDLDAAFPAGTRRKAVRTLLDRIAAGADRAAIVGHLAARGKPVYSTDARNPGLVVRIDPDGTRTPGRIENRRFVAAGPRAR